MAWRIAKSLEKLRMQLNAKFPNRSKVSDGGIGDAAHASRKSDHNPWVKDSKGVGVVTARDFTFDNNPNDGIGIDCHALARVLFHSGDKRIKYIIWNGQITVQDGGSRLAGWKNYTGPNPHKHHLHLSVASSPALYDDEREWDLSALSSPVTADQPTKSPTVEPVSSPAQSYVVKAGDTASGICRKFGIELKKFKDLNNLNNNYEIKIGQTVKVA